MRRRDDEQNVHLLRDECALAGTPMAGDEEMADLFDALRDARDLSAATAPSAALTMLLDRGFDPADRSRSQRLRRAFAARFAATGLTLKVLIGIGAVGAGVATAGVVGSVPGEAIVSDGIDLISPNGGDESGRSDDPSRLEDRRGEPPGVEDGTIPADGPAASSGTAPEPGFPPAADLPPVSPGETSADPDTGGTDPDTSGTNPNAGGANGNAGGNGAIHRDADVHVPKVGDPPVNGGGPTGGIVGGPRTGAPGTDGAPVVGPGDGTVRAPVIPETPPPAATRPASSR